MKTVRWTWVYRRFARHLPAPHPGDLHRLVGLFCPQVLQKLVLRHSFRRQAGEQHPLRRRFQLLLDRGSPGPQRHPLGGSQPRRLQAAIEAFFGINRPAPLVLSPHLPYGGAALRPPALPGGVGGVAPHHPGSLPWVIRRIAPHLLTIALALIFSGTIQNISYGQNGFLSAALLGGGLICLDHARPRGHPPGAADV